ncbi:HlyD family secretion protein [Flavobacteriaceae bacterium F89]|uniref:HlyD family secretion protein n=1 Tax=Cerina litoralis TaxID=2874477 RepID=A0AAE3ET78_9FLAO|nr:HlyD family efflux transporter periplasmic adaptor subunit [Cerina litoralis]MCG2460523.1 HlyD family secretion protein [Cerina litoralis]
MKNFNNNGMELWEVNSYLKREPHWIAKWGTAVFFVFFLLVLFFASIFSFNEVVSTQVMVTTTSPPLHILTKQTGRISSVNYFPGDTVQKDAVLGVLENTSETDDVLEIEKNLLSDSVGIKDLENLNRQFPPDLTLGLKILPAYNQFLTSYHRLILYRSLDDKGIQELELKKRTNNKDLAIANKQEEYHSIQRKIILAETSLERYRSLYSKGVVSRQDLELMEVNLLNAEREFRVLNQNLNQLRLEKTTLNRTQDLMYNEEFKKENVFISDFLLARQNLSAAISEWKEEYLLRSPITGRISFFDVWGKYQNVKQGETVFTIVPLIKGHFIGKCKVPIRNSGKVKEGQKVLIKLENYPYREWGLLSGEVQTISEVPSLDDNPGYVVYVKVNGLVTSYGKKLEFRQEMLGNAEILLEKMTLLDRIFYRFRGLWSNARS